jgi:hypothetical protein
MGVVVDAGSLRSLRKKIGADWRGEHLEGSTDKHRKVTCTSSGKQTRNSGFRR